MLMEKGWFDVTMPDLNQSNPLVETYLIQTSLRLDRLHVTSTAYGWDTHPLYPQP